ncbi:MAG: hypothetical protein ACI8SA_001014, partial [Dokdonia sp.]
LIEVISKNIRRITVRKDPIRKKVSMYSIIMTELGRMFWPKEK